MANGGDVTFHFKGDTKELDKATKSASSTLKNMTKLIAGLGIGKMASDFIKTGVQYNAEIEKYQTALTTLTGSAEKANQIISNIKSDAAKTPFDVKSLTQANQLLISTGLDADSARQTILALGDAVSATGGGSDELARMAVNLQQVKNLGKATSMDIKQFAMAGIDIYGLLADYLGVTKQEAASMQVTWDNLNGALINASKSGGKYFQAMQKQSQTLNGQWSTLKDNFKEFAGAALTPVVNILKNNLLPVLNDLFTGGTKIKQFLSEHQTSIILIVGVVGSLTAAIVAYTIAQNAAAIATGIATAATTAFSAVVGFLTSPITLVVLAIGGLVTAAVLLVKNWETVKTKILSIWNGIKTGVGNAVNGVKGFFSNMGTHIGNKVNTIKTKLGEFGSKMKDVATNKIGPAIQKVGTFFGQLPGKMWTHLTNAWNKFVTWCTKLASKAKEGAKAAVNAIKNGFTNLPGNMVTIGSNIVKGIWNGIGNMAQWLFEKIKGFKDAVLNKFKSFFGIHSPSTLFRDELGVFMAQGIGEGFTDEMGKVSKQMNRAMATVGLGDMFELSPTLNRTMSSSNNVNVKVINNMETDLLGNLVNNIRTYSNGAKNDYNYGMSY
mgnify:CR=1 FL=1